MRNENKVLACVDQSIFADYVADYAAWAAERMNAPLELLHVMQRHPELGSAKDHSGAIGFDAQQALINEYTQLEGELSKAARENGRIFLNRLRERAIDAGIAQADVRLRYGKLIETLLEQEESVRLFVLGRRGEESAMTRVDLGLQVEGIVRKLHKPIMSITQRFTEPRRIMFAFDGGIVTRRGVEMLANSPLFRGLPIHILMSGKETKESAEQLAWAKATLEQANFDTSSALIPGEAESVIARTILEQSIDILIMGAYSHAPWQQIFFGSKTSGLLRGAKIPTLILR